MKKYFKISAILIGVVAIGLSSCGSGKEDEQTKQELKEVDKVIKSDQEKADSMKKALGIED